MGVGGRKYLGKNSKRSQGSDEESDYVGPH